MKASTDEAGGEQPLTQADRGYVGQFHAHRSRRARPEIRSEGGERDSFTHAVVDVEVEAHDQVPHANWAGYEKGDLRLDCWAKRSVLSVFVEQDTEHSGVIIVRA